MLKLSPLDFLMIGVPESLLSVLIIYSLARKQIARKSYFIMSIILAIGGYSVRLLPIYFGVHTILSMLILILLTVYFIKIPIVKAIPYVIIEKIIISLSEVLYIFILINLFNIDISTKFSSTLIKNLYEFPYLILIGLAILIIRKARKVK